MNIASYRPFVAILAVSWLSSTQPGLAQGTTPREPYWLQKTFGTGSRGVPVSAGKNLIGRSFVFTPATSRPEPRYGRLTLLSFEAGAVRERRPMIETRHRIEYLPVHFRLPAYSQDRLGLGDEHIKGQLSVWRQVGEVDNAPIEMLGAVREVSGAEIKEVMGLIAKAETAERLQRQMEASLPASTPRAALDLHDEVNGHVVEDLYFGRFGTTKTPTDPSRIRAMYVAYHVAWGEKFGRTTREPVTPLIERVDEVDRRSGQTVARGREDVIAIVRTPYFSRFRDARDALIADQAVNYVSTMGTFAQVNAAPTGLNITEFQRTLQFKFLPYSFDAAMAQFLDRFSASQATIDQLEKNLDRYLQGEAPIVMPNNPPSPASYAALSTWVPRGSATIVNVLGMTWRKPGDWEEYTGGWQAGYMATDKKTQTLVYRRPRSGATVQAWINSQRGLQGLPELPPGELPTPEVVKLNWLTFQVATAGRILLASTDVGDYRWFVTLRANEGTAEDYRSKLLEFLGTWNTAEPIADGATPIRPATSAARRTDVPNLEGLWEFDPQRSNAPGVRSPTSRWLMRITQTDEGFRFEHAYNTNCDPCVYRLDGSPNDNPGEPSTSKATASTLTIAIARGAIPSRTYSFEGDWLVATVEIRSVPPVFRKHYYKRFTGEP